MTALFTAAFVFELIFGIGFIAAPGFLLGNFGVAATPELIFMARLFGSALLAFTTLLWYARGTQSPDLQRAAVRSMFIYYLVSVIFVLLGQLAGLFNVMGWSMIVLHAGFAIWFGRFAFKN